MSAIPEEFLQKTAKLSEEVTKPFPKSRKIYTEGSRADIRVPMREISQDDTHTSSAPEKNPPIYVYDTSGPYTDPEASIDLMKGLPALRERWIDERGDTEWLDGPSSEFGSARQSDPSLADLRFEHIRKPRRAPLPVPTSSTRSPGCTARVCSMRASSLGSIITSPWPIGSGMSTKAMLRYSGGTNSSRGMRSTRSSTCWSKTSHGRICCSTMLWRACSIFISAMSASPVE